MPVPPSVAKSCLGCLGGIVLVSAVFGVLVSGSDSSSRELRASARVGSGQISVTNHDTRAWSGCEVAINTNFLGEGGWRVRGVSIPAGQTVTAGLLTFTASDGTRFDPGTHAVRNVQVDCRQPDGLWTGEF